MIEETMRRARTVLATLKTLKPGDRVEVEPFHVGGDTLSVVELLKKVD